MKHILSFWEDAEEINILGHEEHTILNKFSNHLEDPILLRNNNRIYVAGWNKSDIVVIDNELGKPLITLSGIFKLPGNEK